MLMVVARLLTVQVEPSSPAALNFAWKETVWTISWSPSFVAVVKTQAGKVKATNQHLLHY